MTHKFNMNPEQQNLYQAIEQFKIDDGMAAFPFAKRLARENGWTMEYTYRVIEEYRKYMFLGVVSGHPVTPSDQVDQVWHLHLQYSKSYWQRFCIEVLKKPFHHNPTQGGQEERDKFKDWYTRTIESYSQFFGTEPPIDIWPPPEIRLSEHLVFLRVSKQDAWIVYKTPIYQFCLISAGLFGIIFII